MRKFYNKITIVLAAVVLILCSCEKTTEPEIWDYDQITAYTLEHILLSDTTLIINELEHSTFKLIDQGPYKDTPFYHNYNRRNTYDEGNEMLYIRYYDHLITETGLREYGMVDWTKINIEMNDIEYSKRVIFSFLDLDIIPLPADAKLTLNERDYENAEDFFNDACSLIDSNEKVELEIEYTNSTNDEGVFLEYLKEGTYEGFRSHITYVY